MLKGHTPPPAVIQGSLFPGLNPKSGSMDLLKDALINHQYIKGSFNN